VFDSIDLMCAASQAESVPFARPGRTLVIMAKAPKEGRVKTRLSQSLPSSAVVALYRCLLQDTVALGKSLRGVEATVMCPESDRDELVALLGESVPVVPQSGEGLAAGLTSVFRHFTRPDGKQQVIAFNSDSPHLSPAVLEHAFEILDWHDVVVGPTTDGGYYLIGAKGAYTSLFEGDGMGTCSALDRLLSRIKALQLRFSCTQPFYDIDVAHDLLLLGRELRDTPTKATRTAAWFAEWEQAVAQLSRALENQ
jgi:uncharacterized protein